MKREELVDYHIKAAWHAISRMYNQYAVKHNITTSMAYVLLNIDSYEGTPATKIAPLMGMEAHSLTRILKTMEEKELIIRKRNNADGRMVKIHLTPMGQEKKEIACNTVKAFNRMVREKIPEGKFRIFLEVISRVEGFIENEDFKNYLNPI